MMNKIYQLLTFELDGQRFSVPLAIVERIERAVEITPLPSMPESVLGIVSMKGRIVPVFNMRKRFRLPVREVDLRDHFIFAHTARRQVALVVDAVGEVIAQRDQEIIESGEILPGLEYVEGVAKIKGGLVLIHDLDRFLSLQEESAMEAAIKRHD